MWFRKDVSEEHREWLLQLLKQYKTEVRMTPQERRELEKWVASGRSPYENGNYIYGENGCPLDFVSALRAELEEIEAFRKLPPEKQAELRCSADEPLSAEEMFEMQDWFNSEEELPFRTAMGGGV